MTRRDHEAEDHERRELPALGHGAGRDGRGGVHEHHLEQEQRRDRRRVDRRRQEEALACRTGRTPCRRCGSTNSLRQRRVVAEGRQRADAAHLQREPERPEARGCRWRRRGSSSPSCGRRSSRGSGPSRRSAKPACMNITRKPVTSVQTMLSAVWPRQHQLLRVGQLLWTARRRSVQPREILAASISRKRSRGGFQAGQNSVPFQ